MHAVQLQRLHLVVHQRDQRADDHRHPVAGPVPGDRRHLVADALATAGGHQDDRVPARDDVLDDLGLIALERREAEDFLEDGGWGGGRGHAVRPVLAAARKWPRPG